MNLFNEKRAAICGNTRPASRTTSPPGFFARWFGVALSLVLATATAASASVQKPAVDAFAQESPANVAPTPQKPKLRSVLFVDPSVRDFQRLTTGLVHDVDVIMLDPSRDGVRQMHDALASMHNLSAVHVLSHGAPGAVSLGNAVLSQATLPSYKAQLQGIGAALAPDGALLLYGCDVAQGAMGDHFVNALATQVHAHVAASTHTTGAAALGGDWVLEKSTGLIRAPMPFSDSAVNGYENTLGVTLTNLTGVSARPGQIGPVWNENRGTNVFLTASLMRGKLQFSSNGGASWADLPGGGIGFANSIPAPTLLRYVDLLPADATTSTMSFIAWSSAAGTTTTGFFVSPDLAPTDIVSQDSYFSETRDYVLSDAPVGFPLATLRPTDTGMGVSGFWAIDSQSVPNLFTVSFNPLLGPNATLKKGTGSMPAVGAIPTVTLRYYDYFQTDSSGNPISGQGFAKTLSYTIVNGVTQELADFGADIKVNTTTANDQINPAIATLSTANVVTVWQSAGQGGEAVSKNGIYGQILTPTGATVGGEFAVTVAGNNIDEITPSVAALNAGRFVVAYTTTPGANGLDIGYRIIEANGTVGGELLANTTVAGNQNFPAAATLSDGNFVIVWNSGGQIRAQKFSPAAGAKVGGEVIISAATTGTAPSVAAVGNAGAYVVSWPYSSTTAFDINAVLSTAASSVIAVTSNRLNGSWSLSSPKTALTGLNNGDFVVAWSGYPDSSFDRAHAYFRRYNSSGVAQGSTTQANTLAPVTNTGKDAVTLAPLSGGGFILAWQEDRSDKDPQGIFGRRYSAAGVAVDANEFEINQNRSGDQSVPAMTALASDRFATVWTDALSDSVSSAGIELRVTTAALPSASIAVAPVSVSEDGATNLTYTVTLSSTVASATTVNINTSGTASSGTDYSGGVTTLSIPANTSTGTITIDPSVDGNVEADETVILALAAGTGYTVGTPASATGTILNDDLPSASIAVVPVSVAEDGAPNLIYTITLNQASLSAIAVNYTVAGTATNGNDYAAITSPLVILAGNTSGTITVNPTADTAFELDETVILTLAAGTGYTLGTSASATGSILNDETQTLPTISDIANQTVNEDVATAALSFTVGDAETPVGSLVVTGSSSNTALVPNGNIVFAGSGAARTVTVTPAANLSGTSTITVTVTDGDGSTATDTFVLTVNPVNDPPSFVAGPSQSLSLVNLNAQTVPNWATAISDGDANFVQTLSFNVSNDNNALFSVQPSVASDGTLSYTPSGLLGNPVTVSVSLTDDATAGGAALTSAVQQFTINISSAAPALTYEPVQLPNTSANSEQLRTVFFFNGVSGAGQTRNGSVQITPASGSVSTANTTTVNSCAITGPDASSFGDVSSANFSFVGNTTTAQTLPLTCISGTANRSAVLNCTETRGVLPAITRSWPVSCPTCNLQFSSTLDAAAPVLAPGTLGVNAITGSQTGRMNRNADVSTCAVPKPNPGPLLTSGARRFDRYRITPARSGCVNVQLLAGTGTGTALFHYAVSSFDPANPSANYIADPGSSFPIQGSFQLTATAGTPFDVVVHEVNTGTADLPYTLSLDACTVEPNSAPTISDVANQAVNEDTATSALPFTVADLETPAASLTVNASSSNTALVPNGNIVLGGSGANRTVTVTPAANGSGSSTITLTVSDGSASATDTFVLTVNPVNDTPSFVAGPNQSLSAGTVTAQTVANWASAISDGDPDFAQALSFNVSNNNNALFTVQPTVAANGTLSFTPAGVSGASLVSVSLTDDNTAGAAALTTAVQTFTISVAAGATSISIDDVTVTEGNAGTSNAVFTVSRGNRLTSFTVPYVALAGSAQVGSDYVATSGTLSFTEGPAAPLTQTISVPIIGDLVVEGSETATLSLGAISNVTGTTTMSDGSGLLSITDNDSATVSFNPTSVSQSEANSPIAFTVTLSNPVASGVTLTLNTTAGTATAVDFTAITAGTVSFPANSTSAQTVNVVINNDALDENDENFTTTLSAPVAIGAVTIATAAATGTIQDDDALPALSMAHVSIPEGNVGTSSMNFVVNLTPVSGRDVSFTRATADASATVANNDYVALAAGSITIPAGQTSVSIPVTINGDTVFEGNETLSLNLTSALNATPATLSATGTIAEDDQQPTITTIVSDLPDPSVVGQSYAVNVQVAAQSSAPAGTVNVSDGVATCAIALVAATSPNSSGTCNLTSTTAGNKTLSATYVPASTAFAASSTTTAHQVNAAITTLSLTGPSSIALNQAASYSFSLGVTAPGVGTPAGLLSVQSGAQSCQITLPNASSSCNLSFSSVGQKAVSASFAPSNSDFAASNTSINVNTLVFVRSDISVSKSDGVSTYRANDLLVYTITLRNAGVDAAAQLRLLDNVPASLDNVSWTCSASGGAVCPASGGVGSINQLLALLPANAQVIYTLSGSVNGSPATISNTATVQLPNDGTVVVTTPANLSATDLNFLDFLFRNGFEDLTVNASSGSYTIPANALRGLLEPVAGSIFSLHDANGEALRIYARELVGVQEFALATRDASGRWTLGAWQRFSAEPQLRWTATPSSAGFVLASAALQ
jgi:hypothetical protein